MSSKNKKIKVNQKNAFNWDELRKPWIKKKTGFIVITIASIALAVLTAAQIVMGSGDWGKAILWGLVFGGMVWLVFFGMSWFQGLMHPKTKQVDNSKDQK